MADDICLAVALNCVLAAAIEHADRQRLLEALHRGPAEPAGTGSAGSRPAGAGPQPYSLAQSDG